ncbi:TRAP transporter small permease [Alteribacter natronophilus]|uniref:TRAP transporter small permease n=1 Tax=Alteribacter natronophilus TaxID=2583810 RepID=UPI001485CD6F|nr:TRAP transporter small permease [Alteribacter natronophilus]
MFEKVIHEFSKGLHLVSQVILLGMMFIVTFDVIGRAFFSQPIRGTFELTELGLALVVFFSLSYTELSKEHISIDFIMEKFPQSVQYYFNIVINFLVMALMGLVAWQLWENSRRLMNANATTGDLRLPIYIFLMLAVVGTIAFMLTALLNVVRSIQKVGKSHES